jgi:hypothetical protein
VLAAPVEFDADDREGLRDDAGVAREYLDAVAFDLEATAPHAARLRVHVAGAPQHLHQTLARDLLPGAQDARRGVNPGAARQVAGGQPLVHDARIVRVEVGDDGGEGKGEDD